MINKFFSAETVPAAGETFNACVEGLVDLSKHFMYKQHKGSSLITPYNQAVMAERNSFFSTYSDEKDYDEKNKALSKAILKYSCEGIDYADIENPESMKNPMIKKNSSFQNRFYAIMAMALPSITSGIVAFNYAGFGEVRDTAFGDTAKFEVPSSQLFTVNRSSTGERHGAIQRIYDTEFIVKTENYDITIAIDWFKMVTGRFDLGDWVTRVANSFAHDIGYRVYKTLDDSYATLPAALKLGGFTDANWLTMSDRISAANANASIFVTGTRTALGSVVPSDDGLLYGISPEYVNAGYVGTYKGTNLMLMPNAIKKGTVHSSGTFEMLADDTRLYFLPLVSDRPVKIVMEGGSMQIESAPETMADRELVISVKHKYGVSVATSAWYGIMDLG